MPQPDQTRSTQMIFILLLPFDHSDATLAQRRTYVQIADLTRRPHGPTEQDYADAEQHLRNEMAITAFADAAYLHASEHGPVHASIPGPAERSTERNVMTLEFIVVRAFGERDFTDAYHRTVRVELQGEQPDEADWHLAETHLRRTLGSEGLEDGLYFRSDFDFSDDPAELTVTPE